MSTALQGNKLTGPAFAVTSRWEMTLRCGDFTLVTSRCSDCA